MLTLTNWLQRFFPDQAHGTYSLALVTLQDAFDAAYRAGYAHGLAVAVDFAAALQDRREAPDSEDDDAAHHSP